MQGRNQQFQKRDKLSSTKKSAIIFNHNLNFVPITPPSASKNLAASTFIHSQHQYLSPQSTRRSNKYQINLGSGLNEIQRHKSIKADTLRDKNNKQSGQQYNQNINNNFIRLKVQEMAFKIKTKLTTLLKQINISGEQISKYSKLVKIDDMLNFLSEKVKQKLALSQVTSGNSLRLRQKQKQMVEDLSELTESLRNKLQEKETIEKQQKLKLKDNHTEIKSLYDQITQKQRQISVKTTQNYQLTILIQEAQKQIASIESKCSAFQRQNEVLKLNSQNQNKHIYSQITNLENREKQYQKQIKQLKETITMLSQKQAKLMNLNMGITQQVQRWRQRFQSHREEKSYQTHTSRQKQKSQQFNITSKFNEKKQIQEFVKEQTKSIRSYSVQETNQLLTVISIHQKQINDLKNQNYNLQLLLQQKNGVLENQIDKVLQKKEIFIPKTKNELQIYYKRKMQEMIGQWRSKLVEVVDSYTADQNKMNAKLQDLQKQIKQSNKKIISLANQKYVLENTMIQRDDQIYKLNKKLQQLSTNTSKSQSNSQKQVNLNQFVESNSLFDKIKSDNKDKQIAEEIKIKDLEDK